MNLIEFEEVNITFAKDQPAYLPLPAYKYKDDPQGTIVFCWQLSWRERWLVFWRGILWHRVLTFHHPLQPLMLEIEKPEMPSHADK